MRIRLVLTVSLVALLVWSQVALAVHQLDHVGDLQTHECLICLAADNPELGLAQNTVSPTDFIPAYLIADRVKSQHHCLQSVIYRVRAPPHSFSLV